MNGTGAGPTTATLEPTTMDNKEGVACVASSNIEQSPNGKKTGQGRGGHCGSGRQSHQQTQVPKRQKRLTDGFMNHQHAGNLACKTLAPIPAPLPRKKGKQNTVSSRWVCHSLRNTKGKRDNALSGTSETEGVQDSCWVTSRHRSAQDAERRNIAARPASPCTGRRVTGQPANPATPGALRVEKMWTLGQQREAPANDARRWFIVHQSVSTMISTTTYFGVHW